MLPDECPKCGAKQTLQRKTQDWGMPYSIEMLHCAACGWAKEQLIVHSTHPYFSMWCRN